MSEINLVTIALFLEDCKKLRFQDESDSMIDGIYGSAKYIILIEFPTFAFIFQRDDTCDSSSNYKIAAVFDVYF